MKSPVSRVAAGLLMAALIQSAFAADDKVATVNGKAIPSSYAEVMIAEQKGQPAAGNPEELRGAIKEELIRREILSQAASKQNLNKKANVQAQMDLARQAVLIRAYIQDYLEKHPVSEQELQAEYDSIKKGMGEKEYKARHILVEKEDEAKAIIAKLKGGAKFEELAKESKDPGSKNRGGDLGWANPGMFVPQFSEAMVKLEKGKYTEAPVQTQFGYHVIQLEDQRDVQPPALETVKPQLTQRLQQRNLEKHVAELREKAKVE